MNDDSELEGGGQETERPARQGVTRDEAHAKDKAAFLAEMDAELGAEETDEQSAAPAKPAKKPAAKPAVEDDDEDAEELEASPDDDDEDEDEDAEPDDAEEDEDEEPEAGKDPDLAKRLAAVRRTEQRQREQLERQRADFAREREQWQGETRELREHKQRFDSLAQRAKYDSYAVLRELGVPDEDMELHAQHLFSRSKAAHVKPEHRAAADRAMRERELADKAAAAEKRVEKIEQTLEEREAAAAAEREVDAFLGRVAKRATAEAAPITAALLAKNPKSARAALMVTAHELVKKHGLSEFPKSKDVIAAHERKERRALRERGIEPPAPGTKPATGKPAGGARPNGKPAAGAKSEETNGHARTAKQIRDADLAALEEFERTRAVQPDN